MSAIELEWSDRQFSDEVIQGLRWKMTTPSIERVGVKVLLAAGRANKRRVVVSSGRNSDGMRWGNIARSCSDRPESGAGESNDQQPPLK